MTKAEKDAEKKRIEEEADKLGGAGVTNQNAPGPEKPPKGGKKIEVDEDTLRDLLKELRETKAVVEQLSSNAVATGPQALQVRRKTREYDYTLRKWEDKIVLEFQNMGTEKRPLYIYNIYDQGLRQNVQFVNLVLEGAKEPVKVEYITFLRDAERIKGRKVSQVEHEDVQEYGMIPKKEMAENGYGMFETMVMVPVEVTSKSYTVKLKLSEKDEGGRELEISDKWLNM